jgi:glutamate synthase (NADPH/NADH) small chain
MPSPDSVWNSKFAWAIVNSASPPKRPAAERIGDFSEIYACYGEDAVRDQASRCIQCPDALCTQGCPLSNRIPEWLSLTAQGRFMEAAAVSRSTSNMPEICSRVCPQERLCEGSCILNSKSEPVPIGAIERFINDFALAHGAGEIEPSVPNGLSVAVVGSGPGGIAGADELAKLGYAVTVYESLLVPGGLLVNGIPSFKLEKHVVGRRIDLLRRRGVQFQLGVRVGWDLSLAQLREKFDAVFLAVGAQRAKPLDIPGGKLPGVVEALPFLIQKNLASPLVDFPPIPVEGRRVAVLGGGDTAMDCLRTAIRCGASQAVCLYRRDLANMPGSRKEYGNALEEGAQFEFLTNPIELIPGPNGAVSEVRCVRMELGAPDASGRRRPRPVAGSEFNTPADLLIVAYGFDPVPFPAEGDFAAIKAEEWGGLTVDGNQMTSVPGVFSGGDSVRGPSLVVHAVRDGRRAAQGIHRYLQGRLESRA